MIIFALLGTLVAIAAMLVLARSDALAARIAVPVMFGALLLWLWQTLVEGFGVPPSSCRRPRPSPWHW